jgi:hypothetical protein
VILLGRVWADNPFLQMDLEYIILICVFLTLAIDKIAIERRHTLVFLNREDEKVLVEWIRERGYKGFRLKGKWRFYYKEAEKWYERNEFVRLTRLEDKLKVKMGNELAALFEKDFMAMK